MTRYGLTDNQTNTGHWDMKHIQQNDAGQRVGGRPVVRRVARAVQVALALMSCAAAPAVLAQAASGGAASGSKLAQESLIIKQLPVVEPNLMFTLDDSGSMAFNYLPDTDLESIIFGFHPGEPSFFPDRELTDDDYNNKYVRVYSVYYAQGLLATNDNNVLAARRRSPQVNTLYYNPDVQYKPWVNKDGTSMENANPKAVIYHIGHPHKSIRDWHTLDITGTHSTIGQVDGGKGVLKNMKIPVCVEPTLGTNSKGRYWSITSNWYAQGWCKRDDSITEIAPATYYLKKDPAFQPPADWKQDSASNYQRVSIKDHQSFDRALAREDCALNAAKTGRVCTQAQEYQNFANWFQYHRTRMHVAIAAVGNAFVKALGGDVRVGYGAINNSEGNEFSGLVGKDIDGKNMPIIERGVRRFEGKDREDFLAWLLSREGKGPTPLMRAMSTVNKYFERDDNNGPWGNNPGHAQRGESKSAHLACRRSYHILMTDGQYTFWYPGVTDDEKNRLQTEKYTLESDNVAGDVIRDDRPPTDGKPRPSYQYQPEAPFRGTASGSLADYAMDAWKKDLREDLPNMVEPYTSTKDGSNPSFWQNVTTYTLGFGLKGTLDPNKDLEAIKAGTKQWPGTVKAGDPTAIDDLWHAAINGHGRYVDVQNSEGFLSEMESILADIANRTGTQSGVDVASRALQADNQKFVPSFQTKLQTGELSSFAVNASGAQGALQWSVSQRIPLPNARAMFVGDGTREGASSFSSAGLGQNALTALAGGAGVDLKKDAAKGNALIGFLRGERDASSNTFRTVAKGLGPIVNSSPTYVGAAIDRGYRYLPTNLKDNAGAGSSYRTYVDQKRRRACAGTESRVCGPTMVFVGANEGFLHGFNANPDTAKDGGKEIFAYAPFGSLKWLGASTQKGYHPRLLMDGPLIERDAFWDGHWHNVVIGTTGAGVKSVFALDVTDTRSTALNEKAVLWELSEETLAANTSVDTSGSTDALGHVLAEPEVGVLADGTWVAVLGNGYESKSNRAQLLVVRLKDGVVLHRLDTGVGSDKNPNGLGGVALARDGNQVITGAYAGDRLGNLWKFDMASANRSDWRVGYGGKPMFTTHGARPITAAPNTVTHPLGGMMVLFGTGKLFEKGDNILPTDGSTLPVDAIYGVWDRTRVIQERDAGNNERLVWADENERAANGSWSVYKAGRPVTDAQVRQRKVNVLVVQGRRLAVIPPTDKANSALDWKTERGWRIDLQGMIPIEGQRSILAPQLLSGMALFETMSPLVNESIAACQATINTPGFSLLVDPLSGRMSTKSVIDTNKNRIIDGDDEKVGGWAVENWTGRSVILSEKPQAPCTTKDCKPVQPKLVCPKNSLGSSLQNVGEAENVCVGIPAPTRWWWRELSIPDNSYSAGAAVTSPLEGGGN